MATKVFSAAVIGLKAKLIEVEVDCAPGLGVFSIVGLGDKAVDEAKERVSSAIRNSGANSPHRYNKRVTVNLAPADIKKQGPAYDLAITIGFLLASGQMKNIEVKDKIFIGELSLDGSLRRVNGVLPTAVFAKENNKTLVLPYENLEEAELVEGLNILPVKNLKQLLNIFESEDSSSFVVGKGIHASSDSLSSAPEVDFAYIQGLEEVKRALEIAAAGGHNIFMSGPPGSGKSLLSKALPSILPPMTREEMLKVSRIYSIVGLLSSSNPVVDKRPFRNPHHSSSAAALIGGGSKIAPGEITLSHRGVLFLDELPEFNRDVIEALRQPLEEGKVSIARADHSLTFPAEFILVSASNPCPCGYLDDPEKECSCTSSQIARYRRKLSGPILDRVDIKIKVPRISFEKLSSEEVAERSEKVQQRTSQARKIQQKRGMTNNEMGIPQIKKYCKVDSGSQDLLKQAMRRLSLSPRSYHKILKVSRTIADLDNKENIEMSHVAEAINYQEKAEES